VNILVSIYLRLINSIERIEIEDEKMITEKATA